MVDAPTVVPVENAHILGDNSRYSEVSEWLQTEEYLQDILAVLCDRGFLDRSSLRLPAQFCNVSSLSWLLGLL